MVEGVAVSPEIVGRQCQHANDTSDPVIRATLTITKLYRLRWQIELFFKSCTLAAQKCSR